MSDTLCGLQHFAPWCRGRLIESWKLFRIWRKVERPKQAPPLPEAFVLSLLGRAIFLNHLRLAVCLCLGFWGMLRTGEIMKVQTSHLLLSKGDVIVQLGETKTSLRRAVDENVVIRHEITHLLCQALLDLNGRTEKTVWLETPMQFRKEFADLIQFFQLNRQFRPYSLRRGGATADFQAHGQMERTLLRGRWNTSTAARQYIQQGLGALTEIRTTPTALKLLNQYRQLVL